MSRSNKLLLLGGASVIALAIALGGTAQAVPAALRNPAPVDSSEADAALAAGDPMIQLALRSGGQLTPEKISDLLPSVVGPLTAERAEALPDLMEGIRRSGAGKDVEAAALHTLTTLLAEAAGSSLEEGHASRLMADVADLFAADLRLAKLGSGPHKHRNDDRHGIGTPPGYSG